MRKHKSKSKSKHRSKSKSKSKRFGSVKRSRKHRKHRVMHRRRSSHFGPMQSSLSQQYTGEPPGQYEKHMAEIPLSVRDNFYRTLKE